MINGDNSAIILAGGKSSRVGRAKALLEFDGEPQSCLNVFIPRMRRATARDLRAAVILR